MKLIVYIVFLNIFLFLSTTLPVLAVERSGDYQIYNDPDQKYRLIFDNLSMKESLDTVNLLNSILSYYQTSFLWQLDEQFDLVISSNQNQISNAFATPMPHLTTVFFRGNGVEQLERFAVFSWEKLLLFHEVSHLYQTNLKRSLSKFTHTIFGNTMFGQFPFWWFTAPNLILPKFIIEGNAVYNESLLSYGGRLKSGEIKAIVYQLIKNNKINYNLLINSHINFPYGNEKYWVGGYFFNFLKDKYGIEKVNTYYYYQANHFFNPLIINETFQTTFGKNLKELLEEFIQITKKEASLQKSVKGKELSVSNTIYNTMTTSSDHSKIFILLAKDSKNATDLLEINKKDQKIVRYIDIDLKGGRIFKINNKFYSSSSHRISSKSIKYSLWDKKGLNLNQFNNYFISDMKGAFVQKIDIRKSFVNMHCLDQFNNNFKCVSLPLLNQRGDRFYFKQIKTKRYLYKNDKLLCKFNGAYGKVVDIYQNEVFFIASTKYGSSLFSCKKHKIKRMSLSDTIVDAKLINHKRAVVTQVESTGYRYDIVDIDANPMALNHSQIAQPSTKLSHVELPPVKNQEVFTSKSYNSFFNMKYDKLDYGFLFGNLVSSYIITGSFSDSLNYSFLNIEYFYENIKYLNFEQKYLKASYQNKAHAIGYSLSLKKWINDVFETAFSLNIPLYQKYNTKLFLKPKIIFNQNFRKENSESSLSVIYKNKKSHFLNLFPYDSKSLIFTQRWIYNLPESQLYLSHTKKIASKTYWKIYSQSSYSSLKKTTLQNTDFLFQINTINYNSDFITSLGNQIMLPFDFQHYSSWIPIGIRRIAPYVSADIIYDKTIVRKFSYQFSAGMYSEVLLTHILPSFFKVGYTQYSNNMSFNFSLNSKY